MTVFANGLEIACKAQSNKVIAAFPDVCFTPPENPATPRTAVVTIQVLCRLAAFMQDPR